MKKIDVYHVDAFTNQSFGGNAAGVVPNAEGLTVGEMQKIARELNLSETAFIVPTDNDHADVRVRYFTPSNEIDFCGHATVGLSWILATEYGWMNQAETIKLETNIGIVPVKWIVNENKLQSVIMTQVPPKVKEVDLHTNLISALIGIPEEQIEERYPVKIAFTGNWHLLVPVKSRKAIDMAVPNFDKLGAMNKQWGISTTHLFTFEQDEDYFIYTRDFAPAVGITEDPVTGSANGALAGYLILENLIKLEEIQSFKIGQGHAMGRPGTVDVFIKKSEEGPVIQIGGQAVTTIKGVLSF